MGCGWLSLWGPYPGLLNTKLFVISNTTWGFILLVRKSLKLHAFLVDSSNNLTSEIKSSRLRPGLSDINITKGSTTEDVWCYVLKEFSQQMTLNPTSILSLRFRDGIGFNRFRVLFLSHLILVTKRWNRRVIWVDHSKMIRTKGPG